MIERIISEKVEKDCKNKEVEVDKKIFLKFSK